ncbi:MAG: DNA polymerase I [Bacteroides sp.]|nr:DNA polymerase I [Roseburia sp.]MCM1347227.1 DNA polymerase I [Bacteroides sp.]MCM1421699.1 DNA polymerase I [Bacteroides sp.]
MDKLFLLDAYALIYRAYYALIKSPRINSKGLNTSAILGFVNTLEDVLHREKPQYIGVAFDPAGPTFRHKAFPQYKAQREATPEAIRTAVPYIKKILEAYRIPILEVENFEADDVIGTLATKAGHIEGLDTYMMTPDKDYGQLVSEHVFMYKPKHASSECDVMGVKEVCEKYALSHPSQIIDYLGLVGDSADNFPGCPGIGEKTAAKLIGEYGSIENLIEHTAELKGAMKTKVENGRDSMVQSKFLATIRTDVPIELDLDTLRCREADEEQRRLLFEELEFRALLQRHKGEKPKSEKKSAKDSVPSLFGGDLFAEKQDGNQDAEIFSALKDIKSTKHKYYLVENDEEIDKLVEKILTTDFVSLDTETTSTEAMQAELVGLSFAIHENEAFYVPVPAEKQEALKILDKFKKIYESNQILKIGQNIKYDLMVLANYGIQLAGPMFDTMIAHYILHPELRHNMDYLAEIYLNYKTIHIDELIGSKGKKQLSMRDLSPAAVYEYAAEDADITLQLKAKLEEELHKENLHNLFTQIEMPLVPVLARMERNGVCLDTHSLTETSAHFTRQMQQIEQEIHELAGCDFNISSPKQVGEVLFDRLKITDKAKKTKTGQYVTSEEVLQSLRTKHPVVEKILDYRGYKKLLSTYIDALPQLINPHTGHIHTSYNQAVTTTGRLSSSNPNLQNIPIRDENGKEVRKAFIPDEGCEFFSADYSQIELRIMAHLSGDENMIEAFREGHDIHAATAAKIYKLPISEITSDQRRKAKTANFGIIYGITTFGLAERMQVSRSEAKELIEEYFATYPKVKEYMDKSINMARERGYTETLFGRRCYLPDIDSRNATVRGYAERNAINAPIQGTAADIIKIAMVNIDRHLRELNLRSKMILQVHDELNFSVLPEEKEVLQRIVVEDMESAFSMSVPLLADCGWGTNWLEAH